MGILSVQQMRETVDRKDELFDVPELGDGAQIRLRSISVKERDAILIESSVNGKVGGETDPLKMERLLLKYGIAEPRLTDEDIEAVLETKNWSTIDRIIQKIMAFNGLTKEAEKNSAISFRGAA